MFSRYRYTLAVDKNIDSVMVHIKRTAMHKCLVNGQQLSMMRNQLHNKCNMLNDYLVKCGKKRTIKSISIAILAAHQNKQLEHLNDNILGSRTK